MDKTFLLYYNPETEEWIVQEKDLDDPDKPPINYGTYSSEEEAKARLRELKASHPGT
ncbi:hypothetical protein Nhal_1496 [Nitrosococcus halophilus Nc 4]|uniref:Uncharacterized protein n=1 Tax=Nitrosococcus halophilus (strain Nc4) TaxID=472759 RepID=D5C1K6_NITHN|nr:hypothetical protein [Nitrosococcus halophilus]ADE14639.1 hypothetical protein Nhal_1496 [Nitrosococcus halophilus Nc 4]